MPRRSRGTGSVYPEHKHPSCPPIGPDGERPTHKCRGRYVGMVNLGWRDGKRRRKAVYGNTKGEALRALERAKAELHEHGDLVTGSITVEAWLRRWLDESAAERVRDTTLPGYRSKMERYVIPEIGRVRLDKLGPQHLERVYAKMRRDGKADATVLQTHRILARALKVAHRYQMVNRNVATLVDAPPTPKNRGKGLSPTESAAITEALVGDPMESRWLAAIYLGLRQGEALGLGWEHVDFDEGTITIERALRSVPGQGLQMRKPKSESSERKFPVPDFILEAFRQHRENSPRFPLDLVWPNSLGRPMDPRKDNRAWKALLERAEVADCRLHDARHAAATNLVLLGVPLPVVMEVLGHSNINMTARYSHADMRAMRDAMARLETAHRQLGH